ncbi:MAG: hypothetical protein WCO16_03385 [bacterium]
MNPPRRLYWLIIAFITSIVIVMLSIHLQGNHSLFITNMEFFLQGGDIGACDNCSALEGISSLITASLLFGWPFIFASTFIIYMVGHSLAYYLYKKSQSKLDKGFNKKE